MKNESLKVDFYCEEEYQNRVPEPIESSKSFPKWFTELPNLPKHYTFDGNIYNLKIDESTQNIKKCPGIQDFLKTGDFCLLYTSPSPRDVEESRMPSSA